jgi:hypothetical protein
MYLTLWFSLRKPLGLKLIKKYQLRYVRIKYKEHCEHVEVCFNIHRHYLGNNTTNKENARNINRLLH